MKIFYLEFLFEIENKMNKEESSNECNLSTRDNFPKGLRGGGVCYDL
jgi:hypothetical protein